MKRIQTAAVLSSIVSLAICLIYAPKVHDALFITVFFPLFYLVLAIPLLSLLSHKNRGNRITVSVFLLLQWLRFVLLPATSSASGYFSTVLDIADESSARLASYLCLFELIVTSCFCYALLKYSKSRNNVRAVTKSLSGNQSIYFCFFLAMLILYLLRGRGMFTFIILSSNVKTRASLSDTNLVLQALFEYGLLCFMIVSLYYCFFQYKKTGNNKYVWIALLLSMLRISIISTQSESRMAVLYSVGVSLLLLPNLFPSMKKKIIVSVFSVGLVVIGLLTIYKTFYVFLYGSYAEAIAAGRSSTNMYSVSSTVNSYFYGVKDIARNLHISRLTGLSFENLIADIVQNIFGLKYLLPNTGNTTIAEYNLFIYAGSRNSGQLYSAIAHGYSYFGFFLAPLATCMNIAVSSYLESLLARFKSLDTQYFCCLIFVRSVASMFACFPMTLNYLARTLLLGMIVVGGASIFNQRRKTLQRGYDYTVILSSSQIKKEPNQQTSAKGFDRILVHK